MVSPEQWPNNGDRTGDISDDNVRGMKNEITIKLTRDDATTLVIMGYSMDGRGFNNYEIIGLLECIKIDLYKRAKVQARKEQTKNPTPK